MYLKLFKIFVILLFVVLIFPAGNSFAFKSLTRDQLVYDAIEFCPAELQAYLRSNMATVSAGMHFKERHRHGPYSIDPYDSELVYQQLIKDLRDKKYDEFNTAHAFGVLACFLAETISPDDYKTPSHLIPEKVQYDGHQQIEMASVKPHAGGYQAGLFANIGEEITHKNLVLNFKVVG
jgi:hypothetical protein